MTGFIQQLRLSARNAKYYLHFDDLPEFQGYSAVTRILKCRIKTRKIIMSKIETEQSFIAMSDCQ